MNRNLNISKVVDQYTKNGMAIKKVKTNKKGYVEGINEDKWRKIEKSKEEDTLKEHE